MRSHMLGLAAVLCLVGAMASYARNQYSGYYLATLSYPGGTCSLCYTLTQNNSVAGYSASGSWMYSGNPNSTGQFVVCQHVFRLAGYVHKAEETDFLALSGEVAMGRLNTTRLDYVNPRCIYFAAGCFVEMRDAACNIPE